MEDRVLFSSFNPIALRRIHKILPTCPIGLLALPGIAGLWARSLLGRWVPYDALHPEIRDTSQRVIACMQKRGRRVHTYTVNHPENMENLFQWGVHGIFTDDPPLAFRILSNFHKDRAKPV
jgi:glycerophosphoryl diester phosphodiesterase